MHSVPNRNYSYTVSMWSEASVMQLNGSSSLEICILTCKGQAEVVHIQWWHAEFPYLAHGKTLLYLEQNNMSSMGNRNVNVIHILFPGKYILGSELKIIFVAK